jgi:hypothetical protein
MVYAGVGAVWENPTRGIPMFNPTNCSGGKRLSPTPGIGNIVTVQLIHYLDIVAKSNIIFVFVLAPWNDS